MTECKEKTLKHNMSLNIESLFQKIPVLGRIHEEKIAA
jgi:hypothetical protein